VCVCVRESVRVCECGRESELASYECMWEYASVCERECVCESVCVCECERESELASYNQVGVQRSAHDACVVRVSVYVLVCV